MKFWAIALILCSLLPFSADAHGTAYLDFSPDVSEDFNLNEATSVAQIFLPQNEHLGGLDFWIDNAGSSGALTIQIRDDNGSLVAARTVTVPHINPLEGGLQFHIELNNQIPIIDDNVYKINLISSLPELRFYYGDRIIFVEHNAPQASIYLNGASEIDGEEQQFSFKFALYEYQEAVAPVITNEQVTVLSPTLAELSFNANEPVDYRVVYGVSGSGVTQDTGYRGGYLYCGEGLDLCSLNLNTVSDSNYSYTLHVKDIWGNESQSTGTFISGSSGQTPTPTPTPTESVSPTPPPPDTTDPIITNERVVESGSSWVKVAWTTNEAATSEAILRTLPNLITGGANFDNTVELEHVLTVSGLDADTLYQAEINSYDTSANKGTKTLNVMTKSNQPVFSPTPSPSSDPLPPVTIEENDDTEETIISWQESETPGGYRIDIFDANNQLVHSQIVPSGTSVTVPNLPNEYNVVVYQDKNGTYEKVAQPSTWKRPDRRSAIEKMFTWLSGHLFWVIIGAVAIVIGLWIILRLLQKRNKLPIPTNAGTL